MREIVLNVKYKSKPNYRKYKALVDDMDYEELSKYKWSVIKKRNTFYAQRWLNNKKIYMHTFLTGFKQTDHIDGNGLNNQRSNLREVTLSQNFMNQRKRKGTTSLYKGVSWDTQKKKWHAYIWTNNKKTHLGYFLYEDMAAIAYNIQARNSFGRYARLNKF